MPPTTLIEGLLLEISFSTGPDLTMLLATSAELIPVVVGLLRNKAQYLDFKADEEKLKPLLRQFHNEYQSPIKLNFQTEF